MIPIYLEIGQKRVIAGALEWPGWCRGGRDEAAAVAALLDYAPRYARAITATGLPFDMPATVDDFTVVERLPASSGTDFGAPLAIPAADSNDENVIAIADPAIGRLYREEFVRRWGEATVPDVGCEE